MSYIVALELGQPSDSSALAVVGTPTLRVARWDVRSAVWTNDEPDSFDYGRAHYFTSHVPIFTTPDGKETEDHPPLVHELRHLDRWRAEPYPRLVDRTREVLARLPDGTPLVLDVTAVGAAVVGLFDALRPDLVRIVAAGAETRDGRTTRVPKRDLVGALAVLFETGRLRIAAGLPHVSVLTTELRRFRARVGPAPESADDWRDRDEDDLVLAVALAAWHAERHAHVPGAWSVGEPEMSWGATF
ncbi:MAG: hypothetical protein U0529_00410 [Thermoanaerobaculia bacterium]